MAGQIGISLEDDLRLFDVRLKQLKLEYEQYFMGSRPTEPRMLRGEVQKYVTIWANLPIQNTALRFKFNSLCSRFFSFRRQWDATLRKIEEGTYERHLFKAKLHERERAEKRTAQRASRDAAAEVRRVEQAGGGGDLFGALLEARRACGQSVAGLTREKVDGLLQRQRESLRRQYGVDDVRFKVVVEGGRAKLKASAGER